MNTYLLHTRFAILVLFTFLAAGCDLLGGTDDERTVTTGVFVANQGNFTDANGSVTVSSSPYSFLVASDSLSMSTACGAHPCMR